MNSFRTARVAPEERFHRPPAAAIHRGGRGDDMATMTYGEQLRHPQWQRRRLEMMATANFCCQACKEAERTLHVHHKRYVKGRMAWEYSDTELVVLCEECHSAAHETRTRFMHLLCFAESFPQAGITEDELLALCHAFLLSAAGGAEQWDELLDVADSEVSVRASQIGHLAAQFYDSEFSDADLGDAAMLFDNGEEFARLRKLVDEARERLQEKVRLDLEASRGRTP